MIRWIILERGQPAAVVHGVLAFDSPTVPLPQVEENKKGLSNTAPVFQCGGKGSISNFFLQDLALFIDLMKTPYQLAVWFDKAFIIFPFQYSSPLRYGR